MAFAVKMASEIKKGDLLCRFRKVVYSPTRIGFEAETFIVVKASKNSLQLKRDDKTTFFVSKQNSGKERCFKVIYQNDEII